MAADQLAHLIEIYRYWILVPLAFLEGPIVSFIAGTLSSVGYLNAYLSFAILFCRDVIVDTACYALGRFAEHLDFVKRLLAKVGIREEQIHGVRTLWDEHGARTMFLSKLSYGVAAAFLLVAGMVEMPFRKFLQYAALVALVQYGALFLLGYYFGSAFGTLSRILDNIQYVIAGISLFAVAYYIFKNYMRRRLLHPISS